MTSLYPEKEVKKGLEQLYKKIEKHLIDDSPLLQVVWRNMQVSICRALPFVLLSDSNALDAALRLCLFRFQDEFLKQLKHYNEVMGQCYPNSRIDLEVSIEDVLNYFSQFAMQH